MSKERDWTDEYQTLYENYYDDKDYEPLCCNNCDCEINKTYYKVDNEIICKDCLLETIKKELMEDFKKPVEIFFEEDIEKSKNFYEYVINLAKKDNYLASSLIEDIIIDDDYNLWNYLIVDICNIEYFKNKIIENLTTNDDSWLLETYLEFNKEIEELCQ